MDASRSNMSATFCGSVIIRSWPVAISHTRSPPLLAVGRPPTACVGAPLWACVLLGQSPTIAESLRFGASIVVMFITTAAVGNVAPQNWKARRVGREPACLSERANSVARL